MHFYILLLLFRAIADFSYIYFVNPVFGYSGFSIEVHTFPYLFSWALYSLSLFFVQPLINKISDYIAVTFILFILAPLTSLYGLTGWSLEPVIINLLSFIVFIFIARSKLIKTPALPEVKDGPKIAVIISVLAVVSLLSWYLVSGAGFNLNLARVYDFRRENAELANIGILAYLNNWTYKIFSLFLIAYFLHKKKYAIVFIACCAQVVFYGYSAHKGVLFSIVLIFATWAWFSKRNNAYILPLGLVFVFSISLLSYFVLGEILLGSLFIRRVFYVPAYLTFQYFDFFSNNQFVYWSNSVLSGLVSYPYRMSVPMLIGDYEGSGASANNGFISSGFAHFGYIGVFIYTVMFGYLIRFFDVFTKRVGVLWLSLAITIGPLRDALISSDLFTTLLTHGLLLAVFLIFLIRSEGKLEK